jgi:hypothetical protein
VKNIKYATAWTLAAGGVRGRKEPDTIVQGVPVVMFEDIRTCRKGKSKLYCLLSSRLSVEFIIFWQYPLHVGHWWPPVAGGLEGCRDRTDVSWLMVIPIFVEL